MKTDVYSKVWSCGDENYKTCKALEMKACSQRPGVQSPAWLGWRGITYERCWNESGKLKFDQFSEKIAIRRRDIEIQK